MKSKETRRRGGARGELFKEGGAPGPGRPPMSDEARQARAVLEQAMRKALADGGDAAVEFVRQMRERVPEALAILDRAASGEELPDAQLEAMRVIFERAFGRAPQTLEIRAPDGPAVAVIFGTKPVLAEGLRAALKEYDAKQRAIEHDNGIALKPRDLIGDAE